MSTAPQKERLTPPEPAVQPEEKKDADLEAIEYFKEAHAQIKHQLAKVIVGRDKVINDC